MSSFNFRINAGKVNIASHYKLIETEKFYIILQDSILKITVLTSL